MNRSVKKMFREDRKMQKAREANEPYALGQRDLARDKRDEVMEKLEDLWRFDPYCPELAASAREAYRILFRARENEEE